MHILLAHLSTKGIKVKTGINHRVHFLPMRAEINAAFESFSRSLIGTIQRGQV